MSKEFLWLLVGVLGLLIVSSLVGVILHLKVKGESGRKVVKNLNDRIKAWWVMFVIFAGALWAGKLVTVGLFFFLSFLALREFVTLIPTRKSDHRALFWAFFIILPIQYLLVALEWYGMFLIFIPVYAFVFIPIRKVLAGETKDFLASTARIQWGLLVSVYFVSYMPFLLSLPVKSGGGVGLLFFFVLVAQLSDVLQYTWGKLTGRRKIAPVLSPGKTWEGFVGGVLSTVVIMSMLWWATPFNPVQAGTMALVVCLVGFAGGLVMSAIKRDLGAKDWGSAIAGHGGVMDRLDSLCFGAPLFFHLTGFFFGSGMAAGTPKWLQMWMG